jgi:hypothetical protein
MQDLTLNYKQTVSLKYATIPASGNNSNIISGGGMQLMEIMTPANWTTSDVNILVSWDNKTWVTQNNYDGVSWGPLTIPALTASQPIPFYAHWFCSIPYIQIVSVTAQSQNASVLLAFQPLFQGIHG